jgi:hypothetical protein
MFEITISNTKKNSGSRILVELDRSPLAIPPVVLIGGGDRKAKLKAHYSKCLGADDKDQRQQQLFQFFAFIYGHGKKDNKGLHLVASSKQYQIHGQAVKEFLEENKEMLDLVSGYVVDGIKPVAQTMDNRPIKEILDEAAGTAAPAEPMIPFGQSSVQLPPEEMAQIQALIQEDQARERLAANPQAQ